MLHCDVNATSRGPSVAAEVETKNAKPPSGEKRGKPAAKHGADGAGERRRSRLCSLQFVELSKIDDGFHVIVTAGSDRRTFLVPSGMATQILNEMDIAFRIIRSQM
jgi:hypothetical protein